MRTYFKVFSDKILNGSCVSLEDTGCWIKLLALNSIGQFHDDGEIKVAKKMGYMDEQIATLLKIKPLEWKKWKAFFIKEGRISIDESNIIKIVNWGEYQTEYGRQKPYREIAEINKEIEIIDKRYKTIDYIDISLIKVTKKSYTPFISIFLNWNVSDIIVHRQLAPEMYRAIKSALESYTVEEVIQAIRNYGKILREKKYFWSHSFTLSDFLGRKKDYVAKFKDWGIAHTNYLKEEQEQDEEWRMH